GKEGRGMAGAARAHELLEDPLVLGVVQAVDLRAAERLEEGKADPALFPLAAGRDPEDQAAAADGLLRVGVVHDLGLAAPPQVGAPEVVPDGGHRLAPGVEAAGLRPQRRPDAREVLGAEPLEKALGGRADEERPDVRAEDAAGPLG